MKVRASGISEIEHALNGDKLNLLAVFARPEDEAFGPSGTLAKYAGEGVRVSLVTAARELVATLAMQSREYALPLVNGVPIPREMSCNCRAAGIQRICLDEHRVKLDPTQPEVMQERLVRLIRQMEPQVVLTYAPDGLSGDSDQKLVSLITTNAFSLAGDPAAFPQHFRDGLSAHQPSKLYYSVLPYSVLEEWGLKGLNGIPDEHVTTVLDVSPYSEMKMRAVYCQRHHVMDYTRWLETSRGLQWNEEHFILAESRLGKRPKKERDLFAGLR